MSSLLSEAEAEPLAAVAEGGRVRLAGLAARADLNGRAGTALRLDDAAGRWEVRKCPAMFQPLSTPCSTPFSTRFILEMSSGI